jgi:hypothetical protein
MFGYDTKTQKQKQLTNRSISVLNSFYAANKKSEKNKKEINRIGKNICKLYVH